LGERQLAEPEPWVMRLLGPPPREPDLGLQTLLTAEPRADQPERQAEAEPEQEAEPEANEPEASPEVAEDTSPGPGSGTGTELVEPGVF
jgi:hypothetical protein